MITTLVSQKNPQPKINKGHVAYPELRNPELRNPELRNPELRNPEPPQRYIKVSDDSEMRLFVKSPRWSECIACKCINGHFCKPNTWMIPEDLYKLIMEH